jgi:hypothetical protein
MRLQGGLRCKILKTMKFPAKYSWIRSYVVFLASTGSFRLMGGAKRACQDNLRDSFWGHCATKWGINLQGLGTRE